MMTYELVIIWDDDEKQVYEYGSREKAEQGGRNMMMAFGKQIAWYGTREKR